ncbi:hypothetical protein ACQ7DA_08500 [Zafaria sp. J156]|uniref:hypothetical protein n=1 Tax=Zafaria sp. J156 TaxID=3116490 RepID=UPI002E79F802|nr:hypothetical protein [Zafaria sp. J156]MEE1621236.1 hypothetical protein [Zafaria sp. J156]
MATEFDSQLIESVAVRRNRVTDALLYASNPTERRWKATAKQFLFSVVAAALIAAICVAVAFVGNMIAEQQRKNEEREQQRSAVVLEIIQPAAASVLPREAGAAPHAPARIAQHPRGA